MDSSTPEGTGLTVADAAEQLEALLDREIDSDGVETEEETPQASEEEAEEAPDEEDTSEEGEETDEEPEQPQTFKLKVGGEEVEVTLDELQRGYSREADYTRKTQALAEERKSLTAEKQDFAVLAERTKAILSHLEQSLTAPLYDPDELAQLRWENPAEWAARVHEQEQRAKYVENLLNHKSTLETHLTAEQQRALQEETQAARAKTEAELLKARPEWKDPAKLNADFMQIRSVAESIGLSQEEWNDLATDHRAILVLDEAAKYRALQSKRTQVREKVNEVKAAKPGAATQTPSKVTEVTRAKQRLAKTGRVEDAASLIERLL